MIPAPLRKRLNLSEGSLLQVGEREGSLIFPYSAPTEVEFRP